MRARPSPLNPWLRLLRVPNLFTVPGDPLAGFFLAGASNRLIPICFTLAGAFFLYIFGVILNDIVDVQEDTRDRPSRPLPSGLVSVPTANGTAAVAVFCGMLCLACAGIFTLALGGAVLALILIYNLFAKRNFLLGPVVMGLCRAGSVLLGASAAAGYGWAEPRVLAGSAATGLYIVTVSILARNETRAKVITPPVIGHLVRGLVFVQAALIFAGGGCVWIAALIALMWLPSYLVGRRIPAS